MTTGERLRENIFSLFVLQGVNYLMPLITIPYLVRVLGPEKFGEIAFAQAFIAYFVVLTSYGFNLTATREVSVHRGNGRKVAETFAVVMASKTVLMLFGFAVMSAVVFTVPRFRADWPIYFLSFLAVLGNVLFPVWFFQALERMKQMALLAIAGRAPAALVIFVFVRDADDYLVAAALHASGLVIAGFLSWSGVRRLLACPLAVPSYAQIGAMLRNGWHVFLSTAATGLYGHTNVFILGLLTNPAAVGYFSAAEKLIRAVRDLLGPVSQSIYPHISALVVRSHAAALAFIRRSFAWIGTTSLAASCLLFVLADPLVRFVLGAQFEPAVALVQWMAFVPFIAGLSNVLGIQTMLTFGFTRSFSRVTLLAGVANLALVFPLIVWLGAQGAAIAVLATEVLVTVGVWLAARQRGVAVVGGAERVA